MNRELAIAYVNTLEKSDLAQFFYEAFQQRRENRDFTEYGVEVTAICIAECYQMVKADEASGEEPVIHVLAPAMKLGDIWSPMDTNQTGTCKRCRLQVACAAKTAICPVCDSQVFCT